MVNLKHASPGSARQHASTRAGHLRWRAAAVAAVFAATAAAVAAAVSVPGPGPGAPPAAPARATLAACPSLPGTVTCNSWSGYVVDGVNADYWYALVDVPQTSCPPGVTGYVYIWIGVQGPASADTEGIVQPGITADCGTGEPTYYAWTVLPTLAGGAIRLSEPVNAGDEIYLGVTNLGSGNYVQDIWDFEANGGFWNQSIPVSGGPLTTADGVAFAAEAYGGGVDFQQADFYNAAINGQLLGQYNPSFWVEDPANDQAGAPALVPSAIDSSGQDFQLSWDPGPPGSTGQDTEGALPTRIPSPGYSSCLCA